MLKSVRPRMQRLKFCAFILIGITNAFAGDNSTKQPSAAYTAPEPDAATLVIEAEDAVYLTEAEIQEHPGASGSRVVRWREGTRAAGRADYLINVPEAGLWYFWVRTQAQDHSNNGLYLEINGQRLKAPDDHPMAPTDSIYLRKDPLLFGWEPEWQGSGEGRHNGPVEIVFERPGAHILSLTGRGGERPFIDLMALTRSAEPELLERTSHAPPYLPPAE